MKSNVDVGCEITCELKLRLAPLSDIGCESDAYASKVDNCKRMAWRGFLLGTVRVEQ